MENNIYSVDLSTSIAPVVQEVRGRNYIEYGTAEWANLYPQFLIDLYYNSSTHAAIINATAEMIAGTDIIALENDNLEALVGLKKFLANANGKETLHEVVKKLAFDFKLQGAFALNIIWSQDRQSISEIYHIPCERIRAGKPNELGVVDTYYISSDWSNLRGNKPQAVAAFNVNDRSTPSQILYTGMYSPNMDIYYTPDYNAGCNWALVDQRVAEFHLNNIENGFSGSFFVNFANGIPTKEEMNKTEQAINNKLTGASNSGKVVYTFSDSKENTPDIVPIAMSNADKQYIALQELLMQNILTAHRCTSPMLVGINSDNGFGSNAEELNNAFEIYLNTVVKPYQNHILKTLNKILTVNGINLPLEFVQSKPITTMFSVEEMKEVMTVAEIRQELGLPELKEEEQDFTKMSKMTELDNFLETVEDIPEDWELVDEEVVDGEHTDFDFEEELNTMVSDKLELTSTGRALPSRKSEQDGISKKTYDYYRVRYVYAEDNFLQRKSGKKREFCTRMVGANKLYRKEDIERMSKQPVNKGWGKGGADTYDIFLFKGGANCHHFWLRQIYKTVIGESKTTKIDDAELIGYTKARSEGFTAKKNDKRVAIAPKRMKNNGFVKKR